MAATQSSYTWQHLHCSALSFSSVCVSLIVVKAFPGVCASVRGARAAVLGQALEKLCFGSTHTTCAWQRQALFGHSRTCYIHARCFRTTTIRFLNVASAPCRGEDGGASPTLPICTARAAPCSEQTADVRQRQWKARKRVLGRRAVPADGYILQQPALCSHRSCLNCCQNRHSSSPGQQHG